MLQRVGRSEVVDMRDQGVKRLLLGIEVTLFGGLVALISSSGATGFGLLIALIGLGIALSGMLPEGG